MADTVKFMRMLATVFALLLCCAAAAAEPRLDASSPEKLQASYANMIAALDDAQQQRFVVAMTTISIVLSQRADLGGSQKLMEIIDGKTAAEIIAHANKLAGYVRTNRQFVDASSAKSFSESLGAMILSLPEQKRADFSEAAAKLMYAREKSKTPEAEFLKSVDGKTADEIIGMAKNIDIPFLAASRRDYRDYKIERISPAEAKRLGYGGAQGAAAEKQGASAEEPKPEPLDFKKSLVPR